MVDRVRNFLKKDIWRIRIRELPKHKYFAIRLLRILLLAFRGFDEDKCQLRASALTFYTLLSVVPLMAMAFGIAKGFGFENNLATIIMEKLQGQEEVAQRIIQFSRSFLANTKGGLIAGVGIAVLFWTVIQVLGNIEHSFNDIWGIKKSRTLGRKISEYLSVMMICPILLMLSSSMTVFITSQVTSMAHKISILEQFGTVIIFSLKLLPYFMIWIVCIFIYKFMPNTKVSFKSSVLAGVIAGTLIQIVQWGYFYFQIGVSRHNAIYGSFAALPLFLAWLQVSWLVVLLGAEISFAVDNEYKYEFEADCLNVSQRFRKLLALRIAQISVHRFKNGEKAPNSIEISHVLEAPIRLVREVLYDLTQARILSEIKTADESDSSYQPAQDVAALSIGRVLEMLDQKGVHLIGIIKKGEIEKLAEKLEEMNRTLQKSAGNILLDQI